MEVRNTENAHVTRDHLCGCRIVEIELVKFSLDIGQCPSVLFGKLAL